MDKEKIGEIQTDLINEWEYDNAIAEYRECNHGIKVCRVEDILEWITSMECGGSMQIAKTKELKAQKYGEMLMLKKFRFALTSIPPTTKDGGYP